MYFLFVQSDNAAHDPAEQRNKKSPEWSGPFTVSLALNLSDGTTFSRVAFSTAIPTSPKHQRTVAEEDGHWMAER